MEMSRGLCENKINRSINELIFLFHFLKNNIKLYDLKSKTGWVDGFEDGLLSAAFVDQVIIRIPKFGSKIRGDFYHIAAINIKVRRIKIRKKKKLYFIIEIKFFFVSQDKSINFLTHGDYDVIKLIHYSPITNEVYVFFLI